MAGRNVAMHAADLFRRPVHTSNELVHQVVMTGETVILENSRV